MLDGLFDPSLWPFSVALCMMLLIALMEAVGMLIGISALGLADQILPEADIDLDADADIGSGGGFPGIVVAIMAAERSPKTKVTLIESDQRKSAFLRTAARECGVSISVLTERIEQAVPQNAVILSARAVAEWIIPTRNADINMIRFFRASIIPPSAAPESHLISREASAWSWQSPIQRGSALSSHLFGRHLNPRHIHRSRVRILRQACDKTKFFGLFA